MFLRGIVLMIITEMLKLETSKIGNKSENRIS